MKLGISLAAITVTALVAAGCGSSSSSKSSATSASSTQAAGGGSGSKSCTASIGIEAPLTGQVAVLGQEQLAFAKLAIQDDNKANGTNITLVQGDTQLMPAQATTVTQQFISNSKIVGVVGPAGSQEVEAVGPLFGRAGLVFISGSATNPTLTSSGKNPTFFRTVSRDDVQGPEDANFVVKHLHPKNLMIVDDQEVYSTGLVSAMMPIFQKAGIKVDHESVSQKVTDFSSLVAKVSSDTTVVVLPWQVAANGQQFGKNLAEQHKNATIVGTDGMFSPSAFTTPGSYVSSFGPDITAIPADASIVQAAKTAYPKFGTFGPPVYAATHVLDEAIASACKSGTATRSSVLSAVKQTSEPTSILGQPIHFDTRGDLIAAKWFLFKINPQGKYTLVTNS
ncbi:MAG: branched-chain amino acid ABC transporter substrate-binding protein [Solirubrobacterales bacterium]|nr:branched-chain amino acid ABC transporter substrate-binding protein [Solirubrobacterales bacterium]MBV8945439.1 branched-chain amino acid ABC transporter substrate-binding protein [Solirubrobacterales bacterium]MBV9365397.1 branched-chain amino acid ABC transporter substrate-binding protein [Solirubrobacterales bacterium]MBV9682967.1 branched-chain amino acid ABC transporter substrate-binding protein [Solirubrobacterales bacterium]MBV9809932.1 branched-chain amino acid ABC transporter substr